MAMLGEGLRGEAGQSAKKTRVAGDVLVQVYCDRQHAGSTQTHLRIHDSVNLLAAIDGTDKERRNSPTGETTL